MRTRAALAALVLAGASGAAFSEDAGPRIERIIVVGNRTREALLRSWLPFKEGDVLRPGDLEKACQVLFAQRQFKSVEVSSSTAPGGGANVRIELRDGFYVLPFPFFMGGSGGSGAGLLVTEKNGFKESEQLAIAGFSGTAGLSGSLFADWEGYSAQLVQQHRDYSERRYANGEFSAVQGLRGPQDQQNPGQYGTLVTEYEKVADVTGASFGVPLRRDERHVATSSLQFGFDRQDLSYRSPNPFAPSDAGAQSQVFIGATAATSRVVADTLGVIFGYGLADLRQRIQPLAQPRLDFGGGARYSVAGRLTGSSFSYAYEEAHFDTVYQWGSHRALALRLTGSVGDNLPAGRQLTTGRTDAGLQGDYALEYRGEGVMGGNLTYSHPFRVTTRGIWQGMLFVEAARLWSSGVPHDKEGVGASFWYRFWRFPIPLGFGATYSLDDRNMQFSGAVGGRF